MDNPWAVDSLQKFNYYCCPECEIKCQAKQEFIKHAFEHHPSGAIALYGIKDSDVEFPETLKKEEIKDENEQEDLEDQVVQDLDFGIIPDEDDDDYENIIADENVINANEEDEDFKGDFKCLVCSQMFDTAGKLSNHSCTTKTEKCSKCDFEAKTVAILNHHVRKMHKEDLTCVQCDLKFNTQHKLRLHMLKEHKINKDQERCLCSLCGKTLVGRSNFKKHEREKHGIDNISRKRIVKPLKINCSKCSSNFNSVVELNIHATTCQEVSHNFQCPSCPLTWCSGPVLNLHLKADHKMGEIYTCNVCGKCFKRKISVDSHNKVEHEGIKDHVCHLCGTGFARAQGLKFHIQRVHEHSGRYACEYCDFKTVAQMKLDIHVNEVHTKAIKFHCQECNFFCYRKGGLLAHVKTVHLKLKPHECPTCPEAYGRRKELEKHRSLTGH